MRTGEYLTAQKPAGSGGKLKATKEKKVAESAYSVAPVGGPAKALKSKAAPSSAAAVGAVASASAAAKTGKRPPAPGGGKKVVRSEIPYAKPFSKPGKKPKGSKRIGGTKFGGMTPPGKFENKGKGLG